MKPLLLLILITTLSNSLHAQSQPQWRLKTAAMDFFKDGQFLTTDSYMYHYSGERGGEITPETVDHSLYDYRWTNLTSKDALRMWDRCVHYYEDNGKLEESCTFLQEFDSYNNVTRHGCTQSFSGFDTFHYNTANKLAQINFFGGLIHRYTYHASGNVDSIITFFFNPNTLMWEVGDFMYHRYDGANNLVHKHHYRPTFINQNTDWYYYYDAANQLAEMKEYGMYGSNNLIDTYSVWKYTYLPNGQLDDAVWRLRSDDTFNFTAWHHYNYNQVNQRTTLTVSGFDLANQVWYPFAKRDYLYNANGLLTEQNTRVWNNTTNSWEYRQSWYSNFTSSRSRFTYEIFWPVNVSHTKTQQTDVTIYPSPATDIITISANFKQVQAFKASITDMQGRTIMQWSEAPTQQYSRTIPIANLPAGIYILRLEGDKESAVRQFVVQ